MVRNACFSIVTLLLGFGFAGLVSGAEPSADIDTDGDGIFDRHEEVLGTDLNRPETLQEVLADRPESEAGRAKAGYDATKDLVDVAFCHVGENRYLWRATFVEPPRLADTVFHLYVDADADSATGRKGPEAVASTGTDFMLSVVGDRDGSSQYDPAGNRANGPPVSHVVDGNRLFVSADVNLGRDEKGEHVRYALYVLCHTTTESGTAAHMSDSTGKHLLDKTPLSIRKKIMRPLDHVTHFGVKATFGVERLAAVLRDERTIEIPHDQLELDGFVVDPFTSRRWPHVRLDAPHGKVWVKAPKCGPCHVGFMMFDDSNLERVLFRVDGELRGVAVANEDNNRTWLYWLETPIAFQGGERVELETAGSGRRHGIVNLVFLPVPPEARAVRYEVENMKSACPVDSPQSVIVSWTTTSPCPTRFEWGNSANYGQVAASERNCLVHRVVVDGLAPGTEYHGRGVGTRPDGSPYLGDDFAFRAEPARPPETRAETKRVPIAVANPHLFDAESWPVTTGVPFPQGVLGTIDHVRVVRDRAEVPSQVRLMARWPDGSVKWLLLSFSATVAGESQSDYALEFGRSVRETPIEQAIAVEQGGLGVRVDTGPLRFRIDPHGNIADVEAESARSRVGAAVCLTVAEDTNGTRYSTEKSDAEIVVEESGPLRAVVKVVSRLDRADRDAAVADAPADAPAEDASDGEDAPLLRIEKRIEAFRGEAFLRVHHTLVVDRPESFTTVESLSYRVVGSDTAERSGPEAKWRVLLTGGEAIELGKEQPSVWQRFDDELVRVAGERESAQPGRLAGSAAAVGASGWAVAVRDMWQNYPKGFSAEPGGVSIGLCPPFQAGLYDAFPFEKQGHQLYYYLLDGQYRLKRGLSKTHELFLCFEPEEARGPLCTLFQDPLLATVDPAWVCGTKAFYDVAPRDEVRFRLYEEAIDKNLEEYAVRREKQHDFGMLNYGDWYGERGTNWGNIEYDTQHAFFLEYARSGNPAAFFLGEATELHNRDIDTVQWGTTPNDVGAVYVHQMCHVGGYYDKPVPGFLGFPRGGYTVSHAWTEGHFDHYFLTGDRRSFDTGRAVADFFIRKQLGRPYDFLSCRTPGWHLIMLAAAYAATNDPYYLNASKVVVDRVLEAQDIEPRPLPAYQAEGRKPYQVGGWSRMMVPGHCQCEPRHRGNAGFMVAVLLSGLKYYHDVTADPRVKQCILDGASYLLDECYSDEVHGFRYTSCPKTGYRAGASPLMVEGVARAYLWTKDDRFGRVLTEALPRGAGGSGYGKGFSMYYRMAPRVLADLEAAGLSLDKPAEEP